MDGEGGNNEFAPRLCAGHRRHELLIEMLKMKARDTNGVLTLRQYILELKTFETKKAW
jgi:hypothetical protein